MKKALVYALLTIMLLAIMPPFLFKPSYAANADSMWVEPPTNEFKTDTTSPGYRFNVTIWLNITSADMFAWQFRLMFDSSQLKATKAGYSPGPTSEWATYRTGGATSPVTPDIEANYVLFTESLQGDNYVPKPVCARLAWVEFEIIAAPPMGGELTSTLSIDHAQTWVEDTTLAEIPIQKIGATYKYTWVAPPKPQLVVDPAIREYGPYPPSVVGTTFTEDIIIKGLSSLWFLKNASTHLGYNSALLEVADVTFGSAWTTTTYDNTTAGDLYLYAETTQPPSGDVLLATVTFRIIFQDTCPPRTPGEHDDSPLDLNNYHLYAATMEIPTMPEIDGTVVIKCLITLPLAYFEVSSPTLGPEELAKGVFNVTVSLKNLDSHWYVVALQFRLSYPADLIEPVALYEGPFLPGFAAQEPGSQGTFYVSYFENWPPWGPHVLYGELLLPNATGGWNAPWPEGEGVVAIITFKPKIMLTQQTITAPLEIVWQGLVGLDGPETQNIVDVPLDYPRNGTYTLMPAFVGRVIDLYGGANNSVYGENYGITYGDGFFWPAPYGGQGPNTPMDLVIPQSEVHLFANVTYNFWPVQNKTVSFEVIMPNGATYTKLVARTDENGVAYVSFRMPWPCDNPESLFGEWKVVATCSLADVVISDTMKFKYDYMVHIWKVSTDKFNYNHGETVKVTIEYGSYAMQTYPVLLSVVIKDELGVVIGIQTVNFTVGGAQYCSYKNKTITLPIEIPKWAYAGKAHIIVNAFDKEPADGGFAWCPEYTPAPEICIQPL
ncbi:MAG: hypothetical protein ACPLW8_02515 [Candidatus Bathyarchaeales archaeon]